MAYQTATLPSFSGVRMDLCEGLMKPDMSPDAYNVDTRSGALTVAGGFSKVMPATVGADTPYERMIVYATEQGNRYFAVAQDMLFLYDAVAGIWRPLYQFERGVTGECMDFLKVRVGTADKLLIACGTEPMIAFDAETGFVDVFGTAEKQSDKKVSYVELYFGRLFAAGDASIVSVSTWLGSCAQTRVAVITQVAASHSYVTSPQLWPVAPISRVSLCVGSFAQTRVSTPFSVQVAGVVTVHSPQLWPSLFSTSCFGSWQRLHS